jgi:hypothetical protein
LPTVQASRGRLATEESQRLLSEALGQLPQRSRGDLGPARGEGGEEGIRLMPMVNIRRTTQRDEFLRVREWVVRKLRTGQYAPDLAYFMFSRLASTAKKLRRRGQI